MFYGETFPPVLKYLALVMVIFEPTGEIKATLSLIPVLSGTCCCSKNCAKWEIYIVK